MKKTMIAVWAAATSLVLAAGIVEETKSQPVLAGSAQIAPFGDVTKKVTTLGTMISNPIVPTLLLTGGQQQLVEEYGRFRADGPITWLAYIQSPAWEVAATNLDQVSVEDLFEMVLVYPSVDGPATMAMNHPGATREADGTVHLLPGKKNPSDTYVKYTTDNRYCAFASSPSIAARALEDFSAMQAKREKEKDPPLVRVEVLQRGVDAIATLAEALASEQQKALSKSGTSDVDLANKVASIQASRQNKAQDMLRAVASCSVTLDLDANGLTMEAKLAPRPGKKAPFASDFALPAGVLDKVPATAPLFLFGGDRILCQATDEAAFQKDKDAVCELLSASVAELVKNNDYVKYAGFLKEAEGLVTQLIKDMPFPGPADWTGGWFAFDEAVHPYYEQVECAARAETERMVADRFLKGLADAVEKQWPGKGLLAKKGDSTKFDWNALIDLCGAEAGVKPGDKEEKEIANAKKTLAAILGAGNTVSTTVREGNIIRTRCGSSGVQPAQVTKGTGEARVAAALPETVEKRPAAVFYLEVYSLVRDAVLPIMAKTAKKQDAKQYKAIVAAMTPAEKNSALAYACWTDPNGSARAILRITANELKNFGSAFNAFTAASLLGADNE